MSLNYPRFDLVIERGEGCRVWDSTGKEYLDLFAGFGASILGHCHPALVKAVTDQAGTLWHVGNLLHTEPQTRVARHIAEKGFGGRSFFAHSGADANEAAIKLARLFGKAQPRGAQHRYKIISATHSFHGRSYATMCATGQEKVREGFEPLPEGFGHVAFGDIEALRGAIDDETIAVMLEPIQGEGGINEPRGDYLRQVRALCDEKDLLLICDEVWTGCGRTGKWFAYQHYDIRPDIMTLGKGVGGGLPVGVCCATQRVADLYDVAKAGGVKHASTLGGNCLSMAAAAAVFETIERDNLLDHAAQLGRYAHQQIESMAQSLPSIRDIRGKGLFIGIELDPRGHGAWFTTAAEIVRKCLERGLMIGSAQQTIVRLAPPLTVTEAQLERGLGILHEVLAGK